MKHSIKNIFRNISLIFLYTTLFMGIGVIFALNHEMSYAKVNNLKHQKEIISTLTTLEKKDIELALIQFNGKSIQLHNEIDKLHNLYKYNYTERYIIMTEDEYLSDLNRLSSLTTTFNDRANEYYTKEIKDENLKHIALMNAFSEINAHIDSMIFKNISYDEKKFTLHKNVTIIAFVIILILSLWYRRRLNSIYNDILYLYAVEKNNKEHTIFSEEIDAISLRMKKKPTVSDNPSMLDPVTGINNNKGMVTSYTNKKGMKESNFTSVTVFEIDNFSKQKRAFSQELTQAILKKIAFTLSLHEQATDVIARTDYNQFTIILSRSSKEQSFKDIEIIRQSISEIKFKDPKNNNIINITVCGGFAIKPNNKHLEDAIKQAKEILLYAQSNSFNRVFQINDIAEHEL